MRRPARPHRYCAVGEELPAPFTQRFCRHERFRGSGDGDVVAGGQTRIEQFLLGRSSQFFETRRLADRGLPRLQLTERAASPQPQSGGERVGRVRGSPRGGERAAVVEQAFESIDVDFVARTTSR